MSDITVKKNQDIKKKLEEKVRLVNKLSDEKLAEELYKLSQDKLDNPITIDITVKELLGIIAIIDDYIRQHLNDNNCAFSLMEISYLKDKLGETWLNNILF